MTTNLSRRSLLSLGAGLGAGLGASTLLGGSALAKQIKETLKAEIAEFRQTFDITPTVAVIRVGDDEASAGYARAIDQDIDLAQCVMAFPNGFDHLRVIADIDRGGMHVAE